MSPKPANGPRGLFLLLVLLVVVVAFLFHESFVPGKALFSNDGPLGIQFSRPYAMPEGMFGVWSDLNWLGMYNGAYVPNFTSLIFSTLGPMGRVNFYAPLSVLVIGLCAWLFFRRIGCNSRAAILAAIAAALNSNYFSNACWGLPSRGYALAAMFLALAAIETGITVQPLLTAILAGLAVGLSITEGGDNGAILSLFVGAYALWRTWIAYPSRGKAAAWAVSKAALMVVFAAVMASATIGVFMRTAVKGMAGTAQDTETKAQKWDENTRWSLPKIETLRLIIPGLFGYRMDTPNGGNYWGGVGQNPSVGDLQKRLNDPDPNVQRQVASILSQPGIWRSSGAGEYAGIVVVLVALWAVFEALRKNGQVFTSTERKLILFWAVMALVAMGLGWGRHAPFYRLIYALPYFSTIRNPMKFFHAVHMCLMILFAYGLLGLNRRYLDVPAKATAVLAQLKAWWKNGPAHERLWTWACIGVLALSVVAWLGYAGSRESVAKYLMSVGFGDSEYASQIARFSAREVFYFVFFFAVSALVVTFIISGAFAGRKANWAALLLGVVMVADLARADTPWILYYDWKYKYESNAVLDTLREKPFEHRVALPPFQLGGQFGLMQQMYQVEWSQHHFPYYNVQSLDIAQEPRVPEEKLAYRDALARDLPRLWQLTNTRYLFSMGGGFVDALNQQLDPVQKRFRIRTAFDLVPKPGVMQATRLEDITASVSPTGSLAIVEFTGALPRVQLYNNWEIIPEGTNVLKRLADANWNPAQTVLISDELAPKPAAVSSNASPGEATITGNPTPKLMQVRTTSDAPAMLLLNDKIEPEWHAYIDGKEAPIYRANFLVRAVHVPAGTHEVTFQFKMKPTSFYVVAGCEAAGLLLLGVVIWSAKRQRAAGTRSTHSLR